MIWRQSGMGQRERIHACKGPPLVYLGVRLDELQVVQHEQGWKRLFLGQVPARSKHHDSLYVRNGKSEAKFLFFFFFGLLLLFFVFTLLRE